MTTFVDHASAIDELKAALGAKVSMNETIREHHSKDESFHLPNLPDAVVFATSTEDVAAVVKICNKHHMPVVTWGAGTSLEGNSNPIHGGVSLDLSQMDKVLRIGHEDLDCTVQPGVRRKQLNEVLATHGLFFPVDPGADATLGRIWNNHGEVRRNETTCDESDRGDAKRRCNRDIASCAKDICWL
jgi:D-lactate dehydrogenase (cytochrome)